MACDTADRAGRKGSTIAPPGPKERAPRPSPAAPPPRRAGR
eukprot:gene36734-41280_t